jgi:4-amino-4-deoxy-L-arabinose transferase-like glycosyltransferase
LAALTLSAGLYLAFEVCGLWLEGEKRAAVPFLLGVIPFYNLLGLKFDQNSALIPLWALAMLAFMRSLETRRSGWAIALGLAAAAAMLVKYWSFFLLAAMALALLFDRRRGAYLRSRAPWISAAIFLVLTVPHLIWLVENHFPPLNWIATRRTAETVFDFMRSLSEYSFGTIGYAAPAVVLVALVIHPSGKAVRDSWFVWEPARRPATLLFWRRFSCPSPSPS